MVASSRFSENLADELRELFLDRGVARLLVRRQLGAAEAEIAQRVLDDAFWRAVESVCEFGEAASALYFSNKRLVLAELGPVLRDLRQVGVVRLAQLGTVHHGVQVRNLAPGAADALVRVLQRRDEIVPGRARSSAALDGRAAVGEQLLHRGRDVLGLDLREARQPGKVQEWIQLEALAAH